mmetsp:Transcript_11993/g.44576  ORF Transcript_11993/g.44576 Transcript_11993/m.44576 type:complete len:218 (-) Transcript_11993:742-1395(-)
MTRFLRSASCLALLALTIQAFSVESPIASLARLRWPSTSLSSFCSKPMVTSTLGRPGKDATVALKAAAEVGMVPNFLASVSAFDTYLVAVRTALTASSAPAAGAIGSFSSCGLKAASICVFTPSSRLALPAIKARERVICSRSAAESLRSSVGLGSALGLLIALSMRNFCKAAWPGTPTMLSTSSPSVKRNTDGRADTPKARLSCGNLSLLIFTTRM